MAETLYRCTKCSKEFPSSQIRYSSDGKKLVCVDCLRLNTQKSGTEAKPQIENKEQYVCKKCSYKFKSKPKSNVTCPYCNSSNVSKNKSNAQTLIADSMEIDFDF